MIDNMEGLPDKEAKRRFQLWLKPSVLDMADDLYAKDNCGSRSEFIEKAIRFYAGYLYAQQSQDYFPKVITSTLKGIMADSTNKISRILFKLTVSGSRAGKASLRSLRRSTPEPTRIPRLRYYCSGLLTGFPEPPGRRSMATSSRM